MTTFISHTSVDAHNSYELSVWWAEVLGYHEDPDDPNLPGHEECLIISPDGNHRLLFIEVPDEKVVKNRIHFDLRPRERTRDDELAWLLSKGATVVNDLREHWGPNTGWVVLADREGNEFCILRSPTEIEESRAAAVASGG